MMIQATLLGRARRNTYGHMAQSTTYTLGNKDSLLKAAIEDFMIGITYWPTMYLSQRKCYKSNIIEIKKNTLFLNRNIGRMRSVRG